LSTEGQNLILIEYKINQILVKSKEVSDEINQKLLEGNNFTELKKQYDEKWR
jgi:hypothetical protein